MKKIYWRPRVVSRTGLTLIALISIGGLLLVEHVPVKTQRPMHAEKLAAAELARHAMGVVKAARIARGHEIDLESDPLASGLIGIGMSPVTTVAGNLTSKQASVNPNFAAVVVELLTKAGVKRGDSVAVGVSGSFPALNVAVFAAIEVLGLKPIVVSSASASQWGANVPDFLWIDMERVLLDQRIFTFRSLATSVGGLEDQGTGMDAEGKSIVLRAIERNGLPLVEGASFHESVAARMKLFHHHAAGAPIKAYVNVGGGTVSTGRATGKKLFEPGLNRRPTAEMHDVDGVMPRFILEGVPIIHLTQVLELADRYDMPRNLRELPEIGDANVFVGTDYNLYLAGGSLVAIALSLFGFIRSDVGFRILRPAARHVESTHPEPMV